MLNPVFSLANMRSLLPTIQPIADKLLERLRSELPKDGSKCLVSFRDNSCIHRA